MIRLNYLTEQYAHLPPQGTSEWLENRKTKIGGSEVASVLGQCKYRSRSKLLEDKKTSAWTSNACCVFGNLFEPVAKHVLLKDLEIEVKEMGSVPDTRFPVAYSPDGLFVKDDKLVLLEIKCPFRRYKLDTIPKHYLPQIKTGMCVLPVDSALFVQMRFRICRLGQIGPSQGYNRWCHLESRKRMPDMDPVHWGYIHFPSDCPLADLGSVGKEDIEDLVLFKDKVHTVVYESMDLPTTGVILGWKLFSYTTIDVERDPDFLDEHKEELWSFFNELVEKSP